jgi:hypothetical protein
MVICCVSMLALYPLHPKTTLVAMNLHAISKLPNNMLMALKR